MNLAMPKRSGSHLRIWLRVYRFSVRDGFLHNAAYKIQSKIRLRERDRLGLVQRIR
jgi:hypothetical protein